MFYLTREQLNDVAAWALYPRLSPESQTAVRLRYGKDLRRWLENDVLSAFPGERLGEQEETNA